MVILCFCILLIKFFLFSLFVNWNPFLLIFGKITSLFFIKDLDFGFFWLLIWLLVLILLFDSSLFDSFSISEVNLFFNLAILNSGKFLFGFSIFWLIFTFFIFFVKFLCEIFASASVAELLWFIRSSFNFFLSIFK